MSQLKATLCITIDGIEESLPVVITYTAHPFFNGRGISPDEPAHCEVQTIKGDGGTLVELIDGALDRMTDTIEFQALLMQDWADDAAAAEDYRAEAIRDERMTREWEAGR